MKLGNQYHRSTTSLPKWGDLEGLYDNHLGSACLELDENALIISYEEYHPFGTTSYRSGRTETEVSLKRYKYNGKERDEETGLYMYGMRYYVAWLCRFISVDPLQFKYPELTPFQYASNNPISMIDLDGMEGVYVSPMERMKMQMQDKMAKQFQSSLKVRTLQLNTQKTTSGANVPEQRPINQADQTAKQAIPINIDKTKLANSLKSERQLQIEEAIANTNPGTLSPISPLKGLQDWANAMPQPIRVATQFDPIYKASGAGMLITATLPALKPTISYTSGAAALADFGAQMYTKQDFMQWNITQTASVTVFKNPFTQSGIGSALEITPENILNKDVSLFKNTIFGKKTTTQFGIGTSIGGTSNYLGGQLSLDLGISNTFINAAAGGTLQFYPNIMSNSIINTINNKDTIR